MDEAKRRRLESAGWHVGDAASLEEIKREALRLDPETRAELAHVLLSSLDSLSDAEIERLWLEEAARRDADLDSGAAPALPAPEVMARARARRA
jgi:hypothetical protein